MIPDRSLAAIFSHCHIPVITFMIKMNQLRDKVADLSVF